VVPPELDVPPPLLLLDELVVPPELELVVPPSGGGVAAWPQVPFDEPGWSTHGEPAQQSAVVVQLPPDGTHWPSHLLFTHGLPQQSALVAHESPAFGGLFVQSL